MKGKRGSDDAPRVYMTKDNIERGRGREQEIYSQERAGDIEPMPCLASCCWFAIPKMPRGNAHCHMCIAQRQAPYAYCACLAIRGEGLPCMQPSSYPVTPLTSSNWH